MPLYLLGEGGYQPALKQISWQHLQTDVPVGEFPELFVQATCHLRKPGNPGKMQAFGALIQWALTMAVYEYCVPSMPASKDRWPV